MTSAFGVATLASSALAVANALQLNNATAVTMTDPGAEYHQGFCVRGRLAPKFFLLGVPKSGTTFFFEDFARSKGLVQFNPLGMQEWREKEPWIFSEQWNKDNKGDWLEHYPKCEEAPGMVAVDCTPGYFTDPSTPGNIYRAYYTWPREQLVFMVFLREPTARAHSHYYQFLENGVMDGVFGGCQPEQFPASFQKAALALLTSPSHSICDCACDNMFLGSFYTDAFERYFSVFDPSQFHVVPFQLAIGHDIVTYTWDLLNVPSGWGEKGDLAGDGNPENHHGYPRLEEEMDAAYLPLLKTFMQKKTGAKAVARVLVNTTANLFEFSKERTEGSVEYWLEEHWS